MDPLPWAFGARPRMPGTQTKVIGEAMPVQSQKIIPALKAFILLFGDILFGLGVVVAG